MANSFPPQASDESSSEGSLPHKFVNETIVQDRRAVSPRSALLSHTSRHDPPHDDNDRNPGVIEATLSERRSPSERRKRERDLSKANSSQRELVRLLVDQEREASKLRKALRMAIQRMEVESQRATDLERANQSTSEHLRTVNENRLAAEEEANKANRELRAYHAKLETVQKEVDRAQESMKELERQKAEAEALAARARAHARKLHQQKMVAAAREEGRRLGFEAGFDHARRERQMIASRQPPRLSLPEPASEPPPAQASPRRRSHRRTASTADDDILPSPEMSLSQLPLRNFPDTPARNTSSFPRHTAQGTPLHPFQPPPPSDSGSETEEEADPPPQEYHDHPPRTKTPSIQVYALDIPPTEQIVRDYHANERSTNDNVVTTQPREEWVTATKYREIQGTSPPPSQPQRSSQPLRPPQQPQPQPQLQFQPQPQLQLQPQSQPVQFPGPHPPPQPLPPRQPPPPANARITHAPARPVSKLFTFAKGGPASWYRSLSRRKKNKPLIDPVPEDEVAPPPSTAAVEPGPNDPETHFGPPPQPPQSWYQSKQVLNSAPPSVRSQDFPYIKRRPVSETGTVSTQISRFDLLATPHALPRNGLDGTNERVREKNSLLSVIKEDPSSRGNTPSKDRYLGRPGSENDRRPPPPQPVFGGQNLHQQSSYATMSSVSQNPRRRRGLSIDVPDPEAPLEPAGVAYQRASGYGTHNRSAASLSRMPSRISEKTTPNTSIGIEIIPPSGVPPELTHSPPHTGVNHLSPYHALKPSSQFNARSAPNRSQVSLGSNRGAPTPTREYPMTSERSGSGLYGNPFAGGRESREFEPSSRSAAHATPKSTRSRLSRVDGGHQSQPPRSPSPNNMNLNNNASQTNLAAGPSNPGIIMPIHRMGSSISVRTTGSYAKYNPDEYTDPAYWGPNGPGDVRTQAPLPRPPSANGTERLGHSRTASRASVNSGLSYV